MFRIAIVTSSLHDYGSDFISNYAGSKDYSIICIVNHTTKPRSKKRLLKKIMRIGILGTLTGIYLRKFYKVPHENITEVCKKNNIPCFHIYNFDPAGNKDTFSEIDLAVSMGNGFIPRSFFSLFKNGMINIHHELLPEFAGASSVIWSLYNNQRITGFTIHQVNAKIDQGDILYKKEMPIIFRQSLGDTIKEMYFNLKKTSIDALNEVVIKVKNGTISAEKNQVLRTYTTPTFWQFLRILKNYKKLRNEKQNTQLNA